MRRPTPRLASEPLSERPLSWLQRPIEALHYCSKLRSAIRNQPTQSSLAVRSISHRHRFADPRLMTSVPTTAARRVAALYEPGRSGAAALEAARQMAESSSLDLTVIGLAPQTTLVHGCCGMSSREYNRIVRDAAAEELEQARQWLGQTGDGTSFQLLVQGRDPPLEEWIAARDFELVLLPARRRLLRADTHPAAARVRRSTSAEVRVIHAIRQPRGRHQHAGGLRCAPDPATTGSPRPRDEGAENDGD